jgi:hypothetical protein
LLWELEFEALKANFFYTAAAIAARVGAMPFCARRILGVVKLKRVTLPARDLTRQRLDFKTRNGYFTEFLTISRCGAEERRRSARRVSQASHSTNWGFGAHQCPCMATRASAPSHHRRKVSCDLIAIGRSEFVITGKPE